MDNKKVPVAAGTNAEPNNNVKDSIAQITAFERAYLERFSFSLFPVRAGDKTPMTANGFKDATNDPVAYQRLHGDKPHNIGMPTGLINGLFVLDIDPRHGGHESFARLMEQYGSFPPTWQATTQSGGTHYFFKWDEHRPVSNRANILQGIDIRGDGGYVLVAPSRVEGEYRWVRSPSKFELLPAPDWLWGLLEDPSKQSSTVDISQYADGIDAGQRNVSFTQIIGHLLGHGVNIKMAWSLVNNRSCPQSCFYLEPRRYG